MGTTAMLVGEFFVVGSVICIIGCSVVCLASTNYMTVALVPLVVTVRDVSRHCQMYPGEQNHQELKNTAIDKSSLYCCKSDLSQCQSHRAIARECYSDPQGICREEREK